MSDIEGQFKDLKLDAIIPPGSYVFGSRTPAQDIYRVNAKDNTIRIAYVKNSNLNYEIKYYVGNAEGEPSYTKKISDKTYGTPLTDDIVKSDAGDGWLNEYKPSEGYEDGKVELYPTIGVGTNVLNVVYPTAVYSVVYQVDEKKLEEKTTLHAFGSEVSVESQPEDRIGYTFSGWKTKCFPSENLLTRLSAPWSRKHQNSDKTIEKTAKNPVKPSK